MSKGLKQKVSDEIQLQDLEAGDVKDAFNSEKNNESSSDDFLAEASGIPIDDDLDGEDDGAAEEEENGNGGADALNVASTSDFSSRPQTEESGGGGSGAKSSDDDGGTGGIGGAAAGASSASDNLDNLESPHELKTEQSADLGFAKYTQRPQKQKRKDSGKLGMHQKGLSRRVVVPAFAAYEKTFERINKPLLEWSPDDDDKKEGPPKIVLETIDRIAWFIKNGLDNGLYKKDKEAFEPWTLTSTTKKMVENRLTIINDARKWAVEDDGSQIELGVTLMGPAQCGKSALTVQLISDTFLVDYDPTIEDSFRKQMTVEGRSIALDCLDTAGLEEFASMREQWWEELDACILVFKVTDIDSFEKMRAMYTQMMGARRKMAAENDEAQEDEQPLPLVICANFCDEDSKFRMVDKKEGWLFASELGCPYVEVSAKDRIAHEKPYSEIVRQIWRLGHVQKHGHSLFPANETSLVKKIANVCTDYFGCGLKPEFDSINKIEFPCHPVDRVPPDDLPLPVLALKNWRIKRAFDIKQFSKMLVMGACLPLVVLAQTVPFLIYRESNPEPWFWVDGNFGDSHWASQYDILGVLIGRARGQDPEAKRDVKWFLRQSKLQLFFRVILSLIISFTFVVMIFNLVNADINGERTSLMESLGPISFYVLFWSLLSSWTAYRFVIMPGIPSLTHLRSVWMLFDSDYKHRTSAYAFLRSYRKKTLSDHKKGFGYEIVLVFFSAILYSMIPGLTRYFIERKNNADNSRYYWPTDRFSDLSVSVGAFVVNFFFVSLFAYGLEIQYSRHFDNFFAWSTDLTYLLSRDKSNINFQLKNKNEKADLFLSLRRKTNALGWLEIRAYMLIEGSILYGETELATLWLVMISVCIGAFVMTRVFVVEGNPFDSILFNGMIILLIMCLLSLFRMVLTGLMFDALQKTQAKLISDQRFWITCRASQRFDPDGMEMNSIGASRMNPSNEKGRGARNSLIASIPKDSDDEADEDEKYADDIDNEKTVLLRRQGWSFHIDFLDNMLDIVEKKSISPKIFDTSLSSVLALTIGFVVVCFFIMIARVVI